MRLVDAVAALSLALVGSLFIMANKLTAFCLSYLTKDLFLLSSNPNKPEHSLCIEDASMFILQVPFLIHTNVIRQEIVMDLTK